jgi:hypothetical protein
MINNENRALSSNFSKTLLYATKDLSIDLTEFALDNVFENEAVKEIPIIKSIIAVANIGLAIKERHFAIKTLGFLKEFWNADIDQGKLDKFVSRLHNDCNYKNRVVDQILIVLDRYIEEEKASIMGRLLAAHITGKINEEEFFEYIIIIDHLYLKDLKVLKIVYQKTKEIEPISNNGYIDFEKEEGLIFNSSIQRLRTQGILARRNVAIYSGGSIDSAEVESRLTEFGIKFYEFGLLEEA